MKDWSRLNLRQESFGKSSNKKSTAWPFHGIVWKKALLTGETLAQFGFYLEKDHENYQVTCCYCKQVCDWHESGLKKGQQSHPLGFHATTSTCWAAQLWANAITLDPKNKSSLARYSIPKASEADMKAWLKLSFEFAGDWPFHAAVSQSRPLKEEV